MQVETSSSNHFIPVRMQILKKSENNQGIHKELVERNAYLLLMGVTFCSKFMESNIDIPEK